MKNRVLSRWSLGAISPLLKGLALGRSLAYYPYPSGSG